MLTVKNLSLYYYYNKNKNYILKDINFTISKGDCLGIIGKSGDGKSTLAKSLLKIFDNNIILDSGNILLNDREIMPIDRGIKVAILFQNPNSYLNPLMKIGCQIDEMLRYHYKENKISAKKKTLQFMKEVGIINPELVYYLYPHELSGGMQQRICLCISLICKPEVLILDECTSYLDKETKKIILDLIKNLQDKYNFTLILISHNFDEIALLCNKVAIMRKGYLVEFGEINEIISAPKHPYTIEIFYDYLRYHQNLKQISFNYEDLNEKEIYVNKTHFFRPVKVLDDNFVKEFNLIKEKLYETIRNK